MKIYLIILTTLCIKAFAQSGITDPTISLRCQELINARQSKLLNKQKIRELIDRNEKLQKITPEERVSIREKLILNHSKLEKELELVLLKIEKQEETIIRQGCPGINI